MGTDTFRPKIAIWTNLYDSHLDYHGTSEAYAKAKADITKNQTAEDYFIYNDDQPELTEDVLLQSTAIKIPFSLTGRKKMEYRLMTIKYTGTGNLMY